MATYSYGRQMVMSTAAAPAVPIALAATPGPLNTYTWAHGKGVKAAKVTVLDAAGRGVIANSVVAVTQPTVNDITLTNLSAAPLAVIVEVEWDILSPAKMATLTGVGVVA